MRILLPALRLAPAFALIICSYITTQAQTLKKLDGTTVSTAQIDKTVKKLMDTANVHGLNLAVINNNKIAYIRSYGYKNKPKNTLLDTATIVYSASFSKAVFGYLVMKLVEEKIINLDKPLYQYLSKPIPEYEYFSDLKGDDRWKLITARMCLSHTTGLPNVRWFHPATDAMDSLGVIRIYFTPGQKYAYSGEGFKLLQLAIEEITKKNIDQLAVERIFTPAVMHRTGFIWHESFGDDNVAVGHLDNGMLDIKRKRSEAVAGGSMVTTIADYARFIQFVMQQKGLKKEMYREMLSPQITIHSKTQFPPITTETTADNDAIKLAYGLGWGVFNCNGSKAFFKEGNGGAWKNYNINFPDKGTSIIIMTNSENGEQIFQELIETVLGETCIPWKWNNYIPYNLTKAPNIDSLRKQYAAVQRTISDQFSKSYYPNLAQIYSLPENKFLVKVDSLKMLFQESLNNYAAQSKGRDAAFVSSEQRDVNYFFDRMVLDYPYFHENYSGEKIKLSNATQSKLDLHFADFNDPTLLSSRDVRGYIESFLRHQSSLEVSKPALKKSDNKRLDAYLQLIPRYFTNQRCRDFWQYYYLNYHLEEWGSKNVQNQVTKFLSDCKDERYKHLIDSVYRESVTGMKDHLIKTYKTVNGYNLDMHIFLPDSMDKSKKRPVIAYFSGGSWTKGNPEWAFYTCKSYAKKGWVAVSVEYRVADRHETTPFEAVKDARSAVRWLRMNAAAYNIDTGRIVVSGNSAGGHLVLTTALSDEWNDPADDLHFSATPNLVMVNAGVYNLYSEDATDWITRDLKDKSIAKKISPQHLLRKGLPPIIIIHGTADRSVDYATAKSFAEEMQRFGNDFEFHTLEGAPHHIWFDRRYSGKVNALRSDFLKKHGYE